MSLYPCPARFDKIIPLEERYITHSTFLKNKSSETTFIGLLTSQKVYKIDPDSNKKIWSIDLVDIHSVEGDESVDPKTLKIVYHIKQSSSLVGGLISSHGSGGSGGGSGGGGSSSLHNDSNNPEVSPPDSPTLHNRLSQITHSALKRNSSTSHDSYISEKILIAESEEIRDQWLISLKIITRQLFQKFFESTYIPAPAIYQLHMYVYKTNRKGKNQIRCIVLSTERLYNISVKQTLELGKIKWSFPISALKNLQVFKNPSNLLIMCQDNKENSKVKETQQFIFKDQSERNLMVNEMRRIYAKSTKGGILNKEERDEVLSK
eukprot:gene5873-7305_t